MSAPIMSAPVEVDQPPHDEQAEQSVLGGMLLSPTLVDDVRMLLDAGHFYLPKHQAIFTAITSVHDRGEPADAVTVLAELERNGDLPRVGGAPYLHTLVSMVPAIASVPYHAAIVRQRATDRARIRLATRIHTYATTATGDPAEQEDRLRALFEQYEDEVRVHSASSRAFGDGLDTWWDEKVNGAPPAALSTGLNDLDELTDLRAGELLVIGARPSIGKTMMALKLARHTAKRGKPVLFVALEMTRNELRDRVVAAECGIDHRTLRDHTLTDWDKKRIMDKWDSLVDLPLYIEDPSSLSIGGVRTLARDYRRRHGIELVVIDYLGLLSPDTSDKNATRERQVAEMSRSAKLLAKELGIPVVLVHQINRNPTQRADQTPQLSDLRESGAIEADANQVWLLHRPEFSAPPEERLLPHNHPGEVQVIVAKNRGGRTGAVWCAFQAARQDISNLA